MTARRWSIVALLIATRALAQEWVELGPAPISSGHTGRVSAIVCSPTDPNRFFVAGADGGVWRTMDGGTTWTPLTDHMPTSAMGALAIDPTNENIIYAGTGEANFANHSRYGLGLYKSIDGGDTWQHLAEETFAGRCFSKLVVDPVNPNVIYASVTRAGGFPEMAAAKGHPGAAGARGVFKSTDGGSTWSRLTGLPDQCATDLVMDSSNPLVLYAAIGRIFGAPENGIYKTTNGGATWTELSGGLPTGTVGRIAIGISPSDPERLYALYANAATPTGGNAPTLGAFRSDNGGATWVSLPIGSFQNSYGWYLCVVTVDPVDPDIAFFGGVTLERTTNAGGSFLDVTPPHVDIHALAWDAAGRLISGDDGGVHRTSNIGLSWTTHNTGLGIIQFYAGLSLHPTNPAIMFGGTQDNGSNRRDSDSQMWTHVFGGDGGWTQVDQANPNIVFVEFQGTGNLFRSTNGGSSFSSSGSGINSGDRNCFLPPFLIHPENSQRMLYATHRIYRSTNGGLSWSPISGDLTDGAGAIRALAQSSVNPEIVYAATNDGNVQVSFDEGATWAPLLDDHPGWPRVTRELFASEQDALTMYLAGAVFGVDQIQRTTDAGTTFETLDGDLPDIPVNCVADLEQVAHYLFAGSDAGVYFSIDDGATWRRYGEGMPNAAVVDLRLDVARGRLVALTQGRGAWATALPARAELTDFTIALGTLVSGGLTQLQESDNARMHVKSVFGFTATVAHVVDLRVAAESDVLSPTAIDLVIEGRLTTPNAQARIRLRNWSTGALEQIHQYAIGTTEVAEVIAGIDAADFVREADGRIEVSVRQSAVATFSVSGFTSQFDQVGIDVR